MSPTVPPAGKYDEFSVDWADVKRITLAALENRANGSSALAIAENFTVSDNTTECVKSIVFGQSNAVWAGFTTEQLHEWLREGYSTDVIRDLSEFTPPIRDKRRLRFLEEGDEFHYDIAASGDDNYMSEWTKKPMIPGLAVEVEIAFSAMTPAAVVNAYNAWVCRAMYSLDAAGVDTEISLVNTTGGNLFVRNERRGARTRIVVKRENESLDFVSFSPMLGPAALRSFGFTAQCLHADARGFRCSSGHGSPDPSKNRFHVVYDHESRKMRIVCKSSGATEFPEWEMTNQLIATLREIMSQPPTN